ncbi:hypothetical protein [Nocardia sp. NPDC127526]|uniref:hypothetical protein n=1 Tax=Nocardia sp. NPDC127526 TaxID=3345393 RepID=UPI00363452DA
MDYSSYSVPDPEPAYSPLSGPISYYDPLAPGERSAPEPPSLPEPAGYSWSSGSDWAPVETPPANGHSGPGLDQPRGGRRRKPDPLDSDFALPRLDEAEPPAPAPRGEGGRRRRFDPDDETTEVRPFRPDAAAQARRDSAPAWSPVPEPGPLPHTPGRAPGFDPGQAQAPAAPPLSRSARRHADEQRQAEVREPEAWHQQEPWQQDQSWQQDQPWQKDPHDRQDPRGRPDEPWRDERAGRQEWAAPDDRAERGGRNGAPNGLPAWSARRRPVPEPAARDEHEHDSESGWSLAEQDQQLLSGETVAGDLLRDAVDREDERADRDSRRGGTRRAAGSRRRGKGGVAVAEPEHDDRYTDVYEPLDEHDEYDEPDTSLAGRLSALTSRFTARAGAGARPSGRSEEDENRRQWLVLAGQSTGAAVAGMLLFKGFERMWEVLPWVALMLAMIVILGLVALVRVLRRTDDIFSTVIAVVVGVFVTLGPLAFLLSTN